MSVALEMYRLPGARDRSLVKNERVHRSLESERERDEGIVCTRPVGEEQVEQTSLIVSEKKEEEDDDETCSGFTSLSSKPG